MFATGLFPRTDTILIKKRPEATKKMFTNVYRKREREEERDLKSRKESRRQMGWGHDHARIG